MVKPYTGARIFCDSGGAVAEWVARKLNNACGWGKVAAIGLLDTEGHPLAGMVFANWNGANADIHLAAERNGRWITREFMYACAFYAFRILNCKRVTAYIASGNSRSEALARHAGFALEHTMRDAHPGGDIHLYVLTAERAARFLELCHHANPTEV